MEFLLKKLIACFLLSLAALGYSQKKINGKVIDSNGFVLKDVAITFNDNNITNTNAKGYFELFSKGSFVFKKKGYDSKTINVQETKFYVIQLSINLQELNEVIVSANHIPKQLKKETASVAVISNKDINRSNHTDFAQILNRTPGVFMQNGALNTNRITIRGVGARNPFGTAKIRAYFKDIPLTDGSGATTLEDFELASIANFEISKGASSSAYGAGLGGVVRLNPQNANLREFCLQPEFSIGSFGLQKSILTANYGTNQHAVKAVFSTTDRDGFRQNNEYSRTTLTVNSNHFFDDKNELTFLASYLNLKAFIPSSLNENDFRNNPESAAFTWQKAKGFEDTQRGIFGLSWNHIYNNKVKQIISIFTSFRENYEPRPFNILSEKTLAFGVRSRLLGSYQLFNHKIKWTVGGELFNDNYTYQTLENLYRNMPEETGSVAGELLSDFKENRNYYNFFAEANYEFSENTTLSVGFNLNNTWYNLDDRFPISENNPDQSGDFSFNTIFSPKVGLSHLFSKNISVFTSVSHGFSPISLEEILLPDGQINTDLKPEIGWNFEIGVRGNFLKDKLFFNCSVYRLAIENLIVSRRTTLDQFIGINAGKTQHDGFEGAVTYNWIKNNKLSISTFTNLTLNKYIFKEFIDEDNDFSGNDLTGVPDAVFNTGVDFNFAVGFYGNINYQYVGSMPITDANTLYSDSYTLTNLKIGYLFKFLKELQVNAFLGINNLFNEKYASQILINASSFGGNAPRYFYSANPVNYFSGINFKYVF